MNKQKLDQYVVEAKRLRSVWSDKGCDFFAYLMQWERDEESWKGTGNGTGWLTFEETLNATDVVKPHQFARFKASVERVGSLDDVRKLGQFAWEEPLKIPVGTPSRKDPTVDAVCAIVEEAEQFRNRNGCPPSRQTVDTWVRKHYEPPEKDVSDDTPSHDNEVKRLKHENAELRKQLAAKEREIDKLKRQLAKATGKRAEARAVQ